MYFKIAVLLSLVATFCHLSGATEKVPEVGIELREKELERVWTSQAIKDSFSLIDKYLVHNVQSIKVAPNVFEAEIWLDSKKSGSTVPEEDEALIKALEQFASLNKTPDKCDKDSYAILKKNSFGSGVIDKVKSRSKPLRRIDQIVLAYAIHHARRCIPLYPVIWREKIEKLNGDHLKRVSAFGNRVVEHRVNPEFKDTGVPKKIRVSEIFRLFVKGSDGLQDLEVACIETIEQLAVDDSNRKYLEGVADEISGKIVFKQDQIDALLQSYIIDPCKYFIREAGGEIFNPASFDSIWIKHERNQANYDFYFAWANLEICNRLIQEYEKGDFVDRVEKSLNGRVLKQN